MTAATYTRVNCRATVSHTECDRVTTARIWQRGTPLCYVSKVTQDMWDHNTQAGRTTIALWADGSAARRQAYRWLERIQAVRAVHMHYIDGDVLYVTFQNPVRR